MHCSTLFLTLRFRAIRWCYNINNTRRYVTEIRHRLTQRLSGGSDQIGISTAWPQPREGKRRHG